MTSWWIFLNHWQRKSIPSKSNWLTCLSSNRAVQLDCSQKRTKYTHMTCYVLNYTSPCERTFFSLIHFLLWFTSKHLLSFELNSETRGRLQQIIHLTLREKSERRKYKMRRRLHLGVLMQAIAPNRVFMHNPLRVSKLKVTFILIIVQ